VNHVEYASAVRAEVLRFAYLLSGADPATPVPTCPGWDLAALAGHVGSTHRWVTAMVGSGTLEKLPFRPFAAGHPADAAALPGWLVEGMERLVTTLVDTPPDRPVWAWAPPRQAGFWSRRMLHEIVIHHADAALAVDSPLTIEPAVAEDGIEEFLTNLGHAGWVPGAAALDADGRTIAYQATDTGTTWLVTLGASTFTWRHASGTADVVVSAPTAADLYLAIYGRIAPSAVTGDEDLFARWTAATPF